MRAVVHRRDLEPERALAVALPEELLHHLLGPPLVDRERLDRVRDVGRVQQDLEDHHALVDLVQRGRAFG